MNLLHTKKIAMKTLTILISILTAMFITTVVMANDADSTRIEKKIVKTVMITDDGKIMVDSTIIDENGKITVHVDTMRMHRGMRCPEGRQFMHWSGSEGSDFDVLIETDDDSTHTMVMGNPTRKHKVIKHCEAGVPECKKMMIIHDADGMPCPPPPPVPPLPPTIKHFSNQQGMIDLNDPSVISYEKKLQKDGTEKITIIRKLR